MMNKALTWKAVKDSFDGTEVGALAIVDGKVGGVVSFLDDRDGNFDGTVSNVEKFAAFIGFMRLNGRAVTYVASQAYADPDLLVAHPELRQVRGELVVAFGSQLIMDGIYAVYFKRPVGKLGTGIAARITSNTVKAFAVRKGFEAAMKKAFQSATP